jgi:hypothetical protein
MCYVYLILLYLRAIELFLAVFSGTLSPWHQCCFARDGDSVERGQAKAHGGSGVH